MYSTEPAPASSSMLEEMAAHWHTVLQHPDESKVETDCMIRLAGVKWSVRVGVQLARGRRQRFECAVIKLIRTLAEWIQPPSLSAEQEAGYRVTKKKIEELSYNVLVSFSFGVPKKSAHIISLMVAEELVAWVGIIRNGQGVAENKPQYPRSGPISPGTTRRCPHYLHLDDHYAQGIGGAARGSREKALSPLQTTVTSHRARREGMSALSYNTKNDPDIVYRFLEALSGLPPYPDLDLDSTRQTSTSSPMGNHCRPESRTDDQEPDEKRERLILPQQKPNVYRPTRSVILVLTTCIMVFPP
ncbi:hypothetical protein L218DRAFT_951064 [Marasmius fiardii PR-910]|nr:hypothetical protein L218DRAFT_951064 [Marasmius fiardii PR-910]